MKNLPHDLEIIKGLLSVNAVHIACNKSISDNPEEAYAMLNQLKDSLDEVKEKLLKED